MPYKIPCSRPFYLKKEDLNNWTDPNNTNIIKPHGDIQCRSYKNAINKALTDKDSLIFFKFFDFARLHKDLREVYSSDSSFKSGMIRLIINGGSWGKDDVNVGVLSLHDIMKEIWDYVVDNIKEMIYTNKKDFISRGPHTSISLILKDMNDSFDRYTEHFTLNLKKLLCYFI